MPTFWDPWPGKRNASLPMAADSHRGRSGVSSRTDTIARIGSKLRLKITAGHAVGTELTVDDELLLGREVPEEGQVAEYIEISRRHARIVRRAESEWEVEDLGSRNATFLNGTPLQGRELLAAGDAIELG